MKNLLKYYWNDKVSMWLLYLWILGAIGFAINGVLIGTGLMGMAALFNIYMVNERGRYIERLIETCLRTNDYDVLEAMNIKITGKRRFPRHWTEIVAIIVLFAGSFFMAGILFYTAIQYQG